MTGKHLCQGLFSVKLQAGDLQLYQKETPVQVFSFEFKFIKNFKNTYFLFLPKQASRPI